jgi:hypothetical protein
MSLENNVKLQKKKKVTLNRIGCVLKVLNTVVNKNGNFSLELVGEQLYLFNSTEASVHSLRDAEKYFDKVIQML